jgi:endogenous inhibitor of DNA gyrase (YacG/DUF329 family)
MTRGKTSSLRCPTCRKIVLFSEPEFPFCSERCRTIDLGKWASGTYVISTPVNDPESGGEAEYTERPRSAAPKRHSDGSSGSSNPSRDENRKPN